MLRTRHLVTAITAAMLLLTTAQTAAQSAPFDNVVVFGDSLSDTGQFFSTSLNAYTKFTTNPGDVAVQLVASNYGFNLQPSRVGGSDYAYGGAGIITDDDGPDPSIPTITQQVTGYLANGAKADPHSLYMIWGGANDIFYHSTEYGLYTLFGEGETAAQATANIDAAATQELVLINQLKQAGARYLVVFNLPNIGDTPSAHEDAAFIPSLPGFLTGVSQSYNQTLNAGLGSNTLGVNTYALFEQVVANPATYGFTNITTPACTTSSSHDCDGSTLVAPNANETYLFADGVHPTTAAHAMLAQVVLSELAAPGQISLLSEAPLTAATEQTHTLRTQMLDDSEGSGTRAFVNVDYAQQSYDGSINSPKTSSQDANFTLGVDMQANENISAGVALGVAHSNAYTVDGGGGYQLKDYSGLAYVTYHAGGGYIGGYGSYGSSNFDDINRNFQIGADTTHETGNTDGSHRGVGFTGGWWFDFGSMKTGPFANLEWQDITVDGYHENGSDATAMWFGEQQREALISTAGWRFQGQMQVGSAALAPYAELAWNRDSRADPIAVTTGLNTMNGSFTLDGFAPGKTWSTVDVGLSAQLTPNVTSWLGYSGRFSDISQRYNSANIGIRFAF